jgi:hypothetical protein
MKIIYFLSQNAYPAQRRTVKVELLTGNFTILGFEAQNWMAIAAAIVVVFAIFVLASRDRG